MFKQYKILILLAVICIVSRLPQLLGPTLMLDGDECVVAVMAKHILTGKDFSLFFYGQAYGFSFIECLFIIPFYWVFGITTIAVKLGMLSLWTIGVLFLYQAFMLISKGNKWLPLLFTLVLICSPAWAVWSMKARGGYLTSFTLTSLLLYLLFLDRKNNISWLWSGVLCFFIYQSQPLWLPGLVPFIAYFLFKDRKAAPALLFLLPVLALFILTYCYKQRLSNFGIVRSDYTTDDLLQRITRIPSFLYSSFHGKYFFGEIQNPDLFSASFAVLFSMIVFSLPLIAVYNIITGKKGKHLFNISVTGIPVMLAYTVLAIGFQARYLLPVTAYTLIALLLLLKTVTIRRETLYATASLFIVTGIVSIITFYNFAFSPLRERSLRNVLGQLTEKGVHYAYCNDNMFTWQVIFYSNEQILCHEQKSPGRYPEYFRKVDSAFYAEAKTVYISPPIPLPKIDFPDAPTIDGYTVIIDPPKEVIAKNFPQATPR